MQTRGKDGIFKKKDFSDYVCFSTFEHPPDPTSYAQASKDPDWREAMAEEFNALIANNTWELVPYDNVKILVGSKWIYKTKYNSDGSIERKKVRLVAQGNRQQEGVDFDETFSPVVKHTTIRLVLSLAVSYGWTIRQLNVKNSCLHGYLTEEVYVKQPTDFVDPQFLRHVCRLQKVIYGLKQTPRAWFHRFSSFLLQQGFFCCQADTSMFIFRRGKDLLFLLLYVDDIIITSNSPTLIHRFISILAT